MVTLKKNNILVMSASFAVTLLFFGIFLLHTQQFDSFVPAQQLELEVPYVTGPSSQEYVNQSIFPIVPKMVVGGRAHCGTTAMREALKDYSDIIGRQTHSGCAYFDDCSKGSSLETISYLKRINKLLSHTATLDSKYLDIINSSLIDFNDATYWNFDFITRYQYSITSTCICLRSSDVIHPCIHICFFWFFLFFNLFSNLNAKR